MVSGSSESFELLGLVPSVAAGQSEGSCTISLCNGAAWAGWRIHKFETFNHDIPPS